MDATHSKGRANLLKYYVKVPRLPRKCQRQDNITNVFQIFIIIIISDPIQVAMRAFLQQQAWYHCASSPTRLRNILQK